MIRKNLLSLVTALLCVTACYGLQETIYSNAYGEKGNPAILFLHGGPGYNSFAFEFSTAQNLADEGYYVIVFDQRGTGRSKEVTNASYTFEEAFSDINSIYEKFEIKEATLIGHSWGGTLGLIYANTHPSKVRNIILVDAPLSYQLTFKTILRKCKDIYSKDDPSQLQYIAMLEKMDTASLTYSSYCFMHAMNCGFYTTPTRSPEATELYTQLQESKEAWLLSDMTRAPVAGFYKEEQYTTIDLSDEIKNLNEIIQVFGIYGAEDELFDQEHLEKLQNLIGNENLEIVANASHNPFLDQQEKFVELVKEFEGD